jgi:nitrogen fixation protein FixH
MEIAILVFFGVVIGILLLAVLAVKIFSRDRRK